MTTIEKQEVWRDRKRYLWLMGLIVPTALFVMLPVVWGLNQLGWHAAGMPVLELTTIGRKSGERRSCMLTSPLQRGDTVVVIAHRPSVLAVADHISEVGQRAHV